MNGPTRSLAVEDLVRPHKTDAVELVAPDGQVVTTLRLDANDGRQVAGRVREWLATILAATNGLGQKCPDRG